MIGNFIRFMNAAVFGRGDTKRLYKACLRTQHTHSPAPRPLNNNDRNTHTTDDNYREPRGNNFPLGQFPFASLSLSLPRPSLSPSFFLSLFFVQLHVCHKFPLALLISHATSKTRETAPGGKFIAAIFCETDFPSLFLSHPVPVPAAG